MNLPNEYNEGYQIKNYNVKSNWVTKYLNPEQAGIIILYFSGFPVKYITSLFGYTDKRAVLKKIKDIIKKLEDYNIFLNIKHKKKSMNFRVKEPSNKLSKVDRELLRDYPGLEL